jgi:hypothetical protein
VDSEESTGGIYELSEEELLEEFSDESMEGVEELEELLEELEEELLLEELDEELLLEELLEELSSEEEFLEALEGVTTLLGTFCPKSNQAYSG